MWRSLHGLVFSSDPDATRAFLRDVLKLPSVDTGGGWLVFGLPSGDLGVHPLHEGGGPPSGTHYVSLECRNIERTVAELARRGVRFEHEVKEQSWGFETAFEAPGGVRFQIFEAKYGRPKGATGRARGATSKRSGSRPRRSPSRRGRARPRRGRAS